jgi:hypothetical protein
MKTRHYIFYTLIFIIGMLTGLLAIMDIKISMWADDVRMRYFMDFCIFVSGFVTCKYSMYKIDGK